MKLRTAKKVWSVTMLTTTSYRAKTFNTACKRLCKARMLTLEDGKNSRKAVFGDIVGYVRWGVAV